MSLENAPTEFIETSGIKFAYRRLGPRQGTPLICLQHFTGTMDAWDPAVVNGLAESRLVIVFDNTMYARFFRWASDRIHENGVIAFVTNRSFIESRTFDGFRKITGDEFNDIYIVDSVVKFCLMCR